MENRAEKERRWRKTTEERETRRDEDRKKEMRKKGKLGIRGHKVRYDMAEK